MPGEGRSTLFRAAAGLPFDVRRARRTLTADVLPTTDYGLRKGYARAFGLAELPAPRAVAERGERWKPFRTMASWYLWRAVELPD